MHLVTVTPIAKGVGKEELTYFSSKHIPIGALVRIPLRNKTVPALVVEVANASDIKSTVKQAPFQLKKIVEILDNKNIFTPDFSKTVSQLASYYATTTGSVFAALIPSVFFDLENAGPFPVKKTESPQPCAFIQDTHINRYAAYRNIIRESFTKGNSVILLTPTIEDANFLYEKVSSGIKEYSIVIHGGLSKKKLLANLQTVVSTTHPIVIIGTGMSLCVPRTDIETIVIEREHSRYYKQQTRPYIDVRVAASVLAQISGAKLIYGDEILSCERLEEYQRNELVPLQRPQFNLSYQNLFSIVNMRSQESDVASDFSLFSEELIASINAALKKEKNIFLLTIRNGLAPLTLCRDCGSIIRCKNCSAPLVVQKNTSGDAKTTFICRHCTYTQTTHTVCPVCGSWRLVMYGVGLQRVLEELQKRFPETPVHVFDRTAVSTNTAARKLIQQWDTQTKTILLGTEMSLTYLKNVRNISCTGIVSLDTLFSIPDFRMNERIFHLVHEMRLLSRDSCVVQTRNEDATVLAAITKANSMLFYETELKLRKQFFLPPYSFLIKITRAGNLDTNRQELEKIQKLLSQYQTSIYPGFIHTINKHAITHLLIHIPQKQWPDLYVINMIRSLPPSYVIDCDPLSVL